MYETKEKREVGLQIVASLQGMYVMREAGVSEQQPFIWNIEKDGCCVS